MYELIEIFSTLEKNIILEKKYYFVKKRERFIHNVYRKKLLNYKETQQIQKNSRTNLKETQEPTSKKLKKSYKYGIVEAFFNKKNFPMVPSISRLQKFRCAQIKKN